jgi:hypothetical protein
MDSTSDMSLYTRFKTQKASSSKFPSYDYWQNVIGRVFEDILEVYGAENNIQSLQELGGKPQARTDLAKAGMKCLLALPHEKLHPLLKLVNQNGITHDLPVIVDETTKNDGQQDGVVDDLESNPHDGLQTFCQVTVDAFLDNDLFFTTKHFLKHAKGSFGLSVTSNLDSHRQMCLAARGQTVCFFVLFCIVTLPPRLTALHLNRKNRSLLPSIQIKVLFVTALNKQLSRPA